MTMKTIQCVTCVGCGELCGDCGDVKRHHGTVCRTFSAETCADCKGTGKDSVAVKEAA